MRDPVASARAQAKPISSGDAAGPLLSQGFQGDPDAAKKLNMSGFEPRPNFPEPELAAYTLIANMLFESRETVMRN
jgi:hypothetical protein